MVVEYSGFSFLFPRDYLQNPRFETYKANEHIFGEYRQIDREFNFD